jgi:glycosyltransferase involved in cell wall biosynthesis
VVGIIGRLQLQKGQDLFLQAARLLARTRADVQFLVVGGAVLGWEGDYPATLHRFAADTPELAGRVHFVDHQTDIYPWYDALDVVVNASRGDGFGLVLVEGMALGRPLVATAEGGTLAIVEHGRSGLLVPPESAAAMAEAIARILDDTVLASRLSEGGRERANAFSAEAMTRHWAELLDDVHAGSRSRDSGAGNSELASGCP